MRAILFLLCVMTVVAAAVAIAVLQEPTSPLSCLIAAMSVALVAFQWWQYDDLRGRSRP